MNPGHSGEDLAPSAFENCMSSSGISPVLSGEAGAPAGSSSPSPNGGACRRWTESPAAEAKGRVSPEWIKLKRC